MNMVLSKCIRKTKEKLIILSGLITLISLFWHFAAVFLEVDTPHGILIKEEIYGLNEIFRNAQCIVNVPKNLPEKNYVIVKI